ncbi:MAG: type I restriction endonuclease subunit M, partial [Candidatus Dormibacteraceae bacterium]
MNANNPPTAKLRLGRIVATPNALNNVPNDDILAGITRHQAGDWGELSSEDRRANDQALVHGTRILSAYQSAKGVKFW